MNPPPDSSTAAPQDVNALGLTNVSAGVMPTPDASAARSERPGRAAYLTLLLVAGGGMTLDLWSKHVAFYDLKQCNPPVVVIPNLLEFQTMLNVGALFGIGAGQTNLFLVASVIALGLVLWMFLQTTRRQWSLHIALGGILAGALGNMYDRVFVRLDEAPEPVAVRFDRSGKAVAARGAVFVEYVGVGQNPQIHEYEEYPRGTGGARVLRPRGPNLVGCVRDFIKIPTRWKLFGREGDLWPWVFNVADMLLVGGVSILAIHLWRDRKPRADAAPEATVSA